MRDTVAGGPARVRPATGTDFHTGDEGHYRPRRNGAHGLVQAATRAGTAGGGRRGHAVEVPGSLPAVDRPRTDLTGTVGETPLVGEERAVVKDQLEALIGQMVDRGILFDEAVT